MILVCQDFKFDNQTLTQKHLISVNFEEDTSLPSVITREMESSEMNKYRPETTGFGTRYSETLVFDIHLMKDDSFYVSQEELEIEQSDYESIASWLSSPPNHMWLEVTKENGEKAKVKGYFSSITPHDKWGICYGLVCTFTCNSPFSYSEKAIDQQISGVNNFLVSNSSSDRYDYIYPTLAITPSNNEEIFIHNLSDSHILDTGMISATDDKDNNIILLMQKISAYASLNNLTVTYLYDDAHQNVVTICDKTALLFYMKDSYGIQNKYVAYYIESNNQYTICQGGFFYCKLSKGLKIKVDAKNLAIYDLLDRPVLFDTMGIQDEDEIYWMRLIYGNNSFCVRGNFSLRISYLEPHKGGLI